MRRCLPAFTALLLAGAALAGYMGIVEPIRELDALQAQGAIAGMARYKGVEYPCTLSVTRRSHSVTHEYDLRLEVGGDADFALTGTLMAARDFEIGDSGALIMNLEGYPSKSRTRWLLSTDSSGLMTRAFVSHKGGFMGIGKKRVFVRFPESRRLRFERLHTRR